VLAAAQRLVYISGVVNGAFADERGLSGLRLAPRGRPFAVRRGAAGKRSGGTAPGFVDSLT
jgi:hypothetical protein